MLYYLAHCMRSYYRQYKKYTGLLAAVAARREASLLLEHSGEVLWVLESEHVADLRHCETGATQVFFSSVYYFKAYEFLRRASGFLFYKVSEIAGSEAGFICEEFYRRQTAGHLGEKIQVKCVFEVP